MQDSCKENLLKGLLATNVTALRANEAKIARFTRRLDTIAFTLDNSVTSSESRDAFTSLESVTRQLEATEAVRRDHWVFAATIVAWFKARDKLDSAMDVAAEFGPLLLDGKQMPKLVPAATSDNWAASVTRCLARLDSAAGPSLAMVEHAAMAAGLEDSADMIARERISSMTLLERIAAWVLSG